MITNNPMQLKAYVKKMAFEKSIPPCIDDCFNMIFRILSAIEITK